MDRRTARIAYRVVLSLSLAWAGVLFVAGISWVRGTIHGSGVPNPWHNWQEFTMPAVLFLYLPWTLLGLKRARTASWLLFIGAGITVIQLLGSNRYNGDSMAAWFFAATILVGLPMVITGCILRWRAQATRPGIPAS